MTMIFMLHELRHCMIDPWKLFMIAMLRRKANTACEWHNFTFQQRGQKDLFMQYYQRELLDAYLLPFLSNLFENPSIAVYLVWRFEFWKCSGLTDHG